MGVFSVRARMRNLLDRYRPPAERGEDVECDLLVDSGAVQLALPAETVQKLKLEPLSTTRVRTADGGVHDYRVCGIVQLEVQGRTCSVQAIELPRGTKPLLGAVPLEEMDWHVSPQDKKLLPNPESPDKPLLPMY
jgi:clan AA aspartic protease